MNNKWILTKIFIGIFLCPPLTFAKMSAQDLFNKLQDQPDFENVEVDKPQILSGVLPKSYWEQGDIMGFEFPDSLADQKHIVFNRAVIKIPVPIHRLAHSGFCDIRMQNFINKLTTFYPPSENVHKGLFESRYGSLTLESQWNCEFKVETRYVNPKSDNAKEAALVFEQVIYNYDKHMNRSAVIIEFFTAEDNQTILVFSSYAAARPSFVSGVLTDRLVKGFKVKVNFLKNQFIQYHKSNP